LVNELFPALYSRDPISKKNQKWNES